MQVEFAMFALGADHSANGLLHLFSGGFDGLTVDNLPAVLPPFWLAMRISEKGITEPRTHELSLTAINPNGEPHELMRNPQAFTFKPVSDPEDNSVATIIVQMYCKTDNPGKHQFSICVDGQEVKRLTLKVAVRNPSSS